MTLEITFKGNKQDIITVTRECQNENDASIRYAYYKDREGAEAKLNGKILTVKYNNADDYAPSTAGKLKDDLIKLLEEAGWERK